MADFTYIVRTKDGIRKEGKIESKNYNSAREELISDGMTIIKLTERDTSFDFLGPFLDRFNLAVDRFKNRIPLDILVFFTRQLSTMFSAGLTIEKSIHFLSAEEKNKKFKKVVENLEANIRKGLLLSDALERHPGVFSSLYISLVRAGEVSGKLSETLDELSKYLETVEDTQRKVKSAMYYPVFIIAFLLGMLFITFTFIIPNFKSVYDQLGSELPYYTVLMVNIGEWMQTNIFSVITFGFISFASIWFVTLTDTGALLKDRVLLRLPIFGKLVEQSTLAKFSKTFGLLISAGVSVLDSMGLLKKVVDNRVYELSIESATNDIENGIGISRALNTTKKFPSILIQLLTTGEETGEIDTLSLKASEFYSKQVNATVDRLTSIIEPLLVVLVGGVIGIIIFITYLPIFHFGEAIGN